MPEKGAVYFNAVSRTRMVHVITAAETDGKELAVDWFVPPGERLASAPHYHAGPEGAVMERFLVLSGSARCRVAGKPIDLVEGGIADIPANTTHIHPRNTGTGDLHIRQHVILPSADLQILSRLERFFGTIVALSHEGKVTRGGNITDPLQSALTLTETLIDPTFLPLLPKETQKRLLGKMAGWARRLGYRAVLEPTPLPRG